MNIARAHSYEHIAILRHELTQVPRHWLDAIAHYKWFVYPTNLSPIWTGLAARTWREDGPPGWCAWEIHEPYWVRETPHIFLQHSHIWAAVHEVGHALAQVWRTPVEAFFNPDAAFNDYMALNPDEYFACALCAFLRPEQDDGDWNCGDLACRDGSLWQYLTVKLTQN